MRQQGLIWIALAGNLWKSWEIGHCYHRQEEVFGSCRPHSGPVRVRYPQTHQVVAREGYLYLRWWGSTTCCCAYELYLWGTQGWGWVLVYHVSSHSHHSLWDRGLRSIADTLAKTLSVWRPELSKAMGDTELFDALKVQCDRTASFDGKHSGVSNCIYLIYRVFPCNQKDFYGGGDWEEEPDLFIFTR